jgi:hypothetical protein
MHLSVFAQRAMIVALLLLGGCAQLRPPAQVPPGAHRQPDAAPGATKQPSPVPEAAEIVVEDPMAPHRGDRPLPQAVGKIERIDCKSGRDDLQARIALEARGNQIVNFAYYSRWNFQTCSIALDQKSWDARWRLTTDGATRVQTPHGSFLIRADASTYRFEFQDVERMRFCGMYGRIRGELIVERGTNPPRCEARGILDLEPGYRLSAGGGS